MWVFKNLSVTYLVKDISLAEKRSCEAGRGKTSEQAEAEFGKIS